MKCSRSRCALLGAAMVGASQALAGVTGPSSSQTPYLVPLVPGVDFTSILSVDDRPGTPALPTSTYKMAGIPDGLGALDNGDGTFKLWMNHEIPTGSGVAHSHGNTSGAFVSQWTINKSDLKVLDGKDLITTPVLSSGDANFNRFCSADLPASSAFFDIGSGMGTTNRIYMNGEETTGGRAFGHVVTGPDAGKSYQLPLLGNYSWENFLANPATGVKTLVMGNDDGSGGGGSSAARGLISVYLGTKTNSGTDVDKAGLTNGSVGFIKVGSVLNESRTTGLGVAKNVSAPFTVTSDKLQGTTFLRPEDGAWDPSNPNDYYFVTTDQYDQVKDGVGATVGRSRLWKAHFDSLANPNAGGSISMLLDGTEPGQMYDNIAINKHGRIILLEDVGGNAHNGKIFSYDIATQQLVKIASHDPARFGDIGLSATAPFNNDEESSGVIDAEDILGPGWFLVDTQAHYSFGATSYEVEGGQLMAMFVPDLVPEPASLSMLGLAGMCLLRRRRTR